MGLGDLEVAKNSEVGRWEALCRQKSVEAGTLELEYEERIERLESELGKKDDEILELEDAMTNEMKDGNGFDLGKDDEIADLRETLSRQECENGNLKYMVNDKFEKIKEFLKLLGERDKEIATLGELLVFKDEENQMLFKKLNDNGISP